jgi:phage shock protein PspC (stress-responsive transcriptional regulator)
VGEGQLAGPDRLVKPVLGRRQRARPAGVVGAARVHRSRTDRKIAGVCGGLASYFNVDPTLIRVLFVVLAVVGGSGVILYLALWLIVPNQP